MRKLTKFGLLCLTLIFINSCVSNNKFKELELENDSYKKEVAKIKQERQKNEALMSDLEISNQQLADAENALVKMESRTRFMDANYQDLTKRYDDLLAQNTMLLTNSDDQNRLVREQLNLCQEEGTQQMKEIKSLRGLLAQCESNFDNIDQERNQYNQKISTCQQKLNELEAIVHKKEASLKALKSKLNAALHNFAAEDLQVTEQGGKIYVSMSQNLLFASNSDQMDWKGKTALFQLAEVLNKNKDISITVEGHTDTDGTAAKNWDLSVKRATSVVKILTSKSVDPTRITASGRAFYLPIGDNKTEKGKALNRRTEIILSPNLDELYEIINQ